MSDSQRIPWSDNPNAPKIPYRLYFWEKVLFAGNLISSIIYGIVIVVFFKCIAALFDPVHRRGEPIKWGLVCYTVVMFLLVTIGTAMQLDVQSISYIDNRDFPGLGSAIPPGPVGYELWFIQPNAIVVIQNFLFVLSNWLADGFLLYRCYSVYSMNLWVIAFPCLMYLGSVAMGITFVYQNEKMPDKFWSSLPYFSISLSLDILLTLMIVVRLIVYTRNTRTALGMSGIGGLCKAIVVMFVESCALYAVNSLLVIGPLGAGNVVSTLFLVIIGEIQVIAPLLIILRIANKSALTSNTIASGRISGFKAWSRGGLIGGGALPDGEPMNSADERVVNSDELAVGVAATDIYLHEDMTKGSPNPDVLRG